MDSNESKLIMTNQNVNIEKEYKNSDNEAQEKKSKKRYPFTASEDQKLLQLVQIYNPNVKSNWYFISLQLNGRNPRQCRERYNLFLKNVNRTKEKWTVEEDKILISQYQIHGPHWKILEKYFKGRTSYNIKNRFNTIKNKKVKFPIHYQYNQNNKNNKNTKNDVSNTQYQSPLENNDELDMSFQIDDIDIFQNDADDFDFFDFSQI